MKSIYIVRFWGEGGNEYILAMVAESGEKVEAYVRKTYYLEGAEKGEEVIEIRRVTLEVTAEQNRVQVLFDD